MTYPLFDIELEVDEDRLQERSGRTLIDDEYGTKRLGARIACALASVHQAARPEESAEYMRIAMRCIAHPHRECRITELSFSVSLLVQEGDTVRAPQIEDMQPKSRESQIRETKKSTKAATLSPTMVQLGVELSEEIARDRTVNLWTINASGIATARALWTFIAYDHAPLNAEQALGLVVNTGRGCTGLKASFLIDARIERPGWLSPIPFLGRTEVSVPLAVTL